MTQTAALELIVAVLRNYGGARFRALPAAASLVKEELCPALLHHCTSDVTEMVSLSLRVFVALVKGFKVMGKRKGWWGTIDPHPPKVCFLEIVFCFPSFVLKVKINCEVLFITEKKG